MKHLWMCAAAYVTDLSSTFCLVNSSRISRGLSLMSGKRLLVMRFFPLCRGCAEWSVDESASFTTRLAVILEFVVATSQSKLRIRDKYHVQTVYPWTLISSAAQKSWTPKLQPCSWDAWETIHSSHYWMLRTLHAWMFLVLSQNFFETE